MNLVAHQILSFNQPLVQIGNHMGEVVKGKSFTNYTLDVVKGIKLHRHIDSFTDDHNVVKQSTARLHKDYNKYSPVIVDVFYDYLLIKNWHLFSNEDFTTFKAKCYELLLAYKDLYPQKLVQITELLVKNDWYDKYRTLEGIEHTLKQMSRKTKFPNNMYMAVKALYVAEESFNREFLEFFPLLMESCKAFLNQDNL